MITAALNAAFVVSVLCCTFTPAQRNGFDGCLPAGNKFGGDSAGSALEINLSYNQPKGLPSRRDSSSFRARCKGGKLKRSCWQEIYFYTLIGCWGNPPANYLEILQRQEREIQRLKRRYTLIQIPCAQAIDPRKIN